MVFYLHFNTSVFSKMLLVTCYFWWGICSIIFRVCGEKVHAISLYYTSIPIVFYGKD